MCITQLTELSGGSLIHITDLWLDITLRLYQNVNMESTALLSAIIQNATDGIITIDSRGMVETINPAGCKLFDYFDLEVIGNNVSMLMPVAARV